MGSGLEGVIPSRLFDKVWQMEQINERDMDQSEQGVPFLLYSGSGTWNFSHHALFEIGQSLKSRPVLSIPLYFSSPL